MAETPRDYNQWVKSVERRLKQALRNGQSVQAVKLARDVENIRDEIEGGNLGSRVPAAPIELLIETRVLTDVAGIKFGEVSVDFPDVVVDVNARDIDVDRYELWLRDISDIDEDDYDNPGPPLVLYATSSESSLTYSPVTQGRWYEVRVRAVAQGVPGPFSRRYDVQIDKDTTPPPIPSALELSSSGATVTAAWDLLAGTGDPMPSDFAFTEVAYGWSPAPDGVFAKLSNVFFEYIFETPPEPQDDDYDGTWYFRHRAVDTSGNRSAWSEQSSIVPKKLVDDESIRFELDANNERLEQARVDMQTEIGEANDRIADFREEWDSEWENGRLKDIQDRQGTLQENIDSARDDASHALEAFEDQWSAEWSSTVSGLRNRQESLESDLTTGLQQAHDEAEALAEAARDDAVSQAAANAQSEYDRLQELAERALSRAGDNMIEDPSFETEHWVDEWNGTGDRLVRTSQNPVRTGDWMLVIEDGDPVDFEFPDIDVELDQSYRMTIWYRTWPSNLPDLSDGESALVFYDSDTGVELAASEPLTTGSTYRRAEVLYKVPGSVQSIRPAIRASWLTGQVIFDDVSVREVGAAAEALRMAEVARQQAEAAHIAAGNAVDTAASAYDAASSKSTVHWSLSAPSGTADNSDDVWWRYELRNGRRVVIGQWFWDNGAWRETEIAEEWLPQVNIGTGTYGDLHGDRLTAKTVRAGALSIMPDSQDFAPDLVNHADMWTLGDDVSVTSSNVAENGLALRVEGGASSATGRAYGPWIPAKAGDTIRWRFRVGNYTRVPDGVLRLYFLYDGSLTNTWTRVEQITSTGAYEGVFTVPSGVTESVAFGVTIDTAATNGGAWAVRDFDVRKQVRGVLIEPEGIKSPQIDTAELTSSKAFIDLLDVNLLQARLLDAGEARIGGSLIKDNTISTEKMLIGPSNLMSDPFFTTLDARQSVAWYPSTRAAFGVVDLGWSDRPAIRLISPYTENNTNYALWFGGGFHGDKAMPVEPGDVIKVRFQVLRYTGWSNDHNYNVSARWRDGQAQGLSYSSLSYFAGVGNQGWHEAEFTAPEGAYYFAIRWIFNSGRGDTHGARGITNISIRRMTGADLIVDGAVLAQHINTESLGADTAFIDMLETNLLRARLLEADSAMIGGNALMNNSVSTRHLVVTNSDNLWADEWLGDIYDTDYIFSTGGAVGSSTFANRFHSSNPPDLDSNSFDWRQVVNGGNWGIQTWPMNSTLNQRVAFRLGPGKGIIVQPGEKYTMRFRVRDVNDGGFYALRMGLFDTVSGDMVSQSDSPAYDLRGIVHSTTSDTEIIWTFTIPDNFPKMHMVPSIHSQNNSESGARTFIRPQLFRANDGKIVVDGLVNASRAVLDELFFDTAVGNSIVAGAGRFLEIESNQIKANAVTADKINFGSLNGSLITGLQIQTHTNNRGVKMTSAGLRGYNSSGSETFRVNASNGNVDINSGTITGATFQTHSQSNRGVKILTSGIRAWDNNGNETFNLSATSGDMTATGTFRTDRSGSRVEVYDDNDGGQIRFFDGSRRASIKMNAVGQRLSFTYGNPSDDVPFLAVERNRSFMQYRSQVIEVGGSTSSNQQMTFRTGGVKAAFFGDLLFANNGRIQFAQTSSSTRGRSVAWIGQRPVADGRSFEIELDSANLRVSNGGIRCLSVYQNTTTNNANMRVVSGTGIFQRTTSASRYKIDPRPLTVPDSLLDVPLTEWIDRNAFELWGELEGKPRPFVEDDQEHYDSIDLQRVAGVIAEDVEEYGGKQFVDYAPDGTIEGVDYDRFSLALIQILKRRNEALEARVRKLEGVL